MSSLLALTGGGSEAGFRQDARFAIVPRGHAALPAPGEAEDPVALVWAEGYGHGLEQAGPRPRRCGWRRKPRARGWDWR